MGVAAINITLKSAIQPFAHTYLFRRLTGLISQICWLMCAVTFSLQFSLLAMLASKGMKRRPLTAHRCRRQFAVTPLQCLLAVTSVWLDNFCCAIQTWAACRLSPLKVCAPSVAQQFLQQAHRLSLLDTSALLVAPPSIHMQV